MHRITFYESLTAALKDRIWELLCLSDLEFVPPLSQRSENGAFLSVRNTSPEFYFKRVLANHLLLVEDNKKNLIGFSSFVHNYKSQFTESVSPSNYIMATIIHPKFRGQGFATMLTKHIENDMPPELKLPVITRCTWTTNHAQLRLLNRMNYRMITRVENARGPGVDTLYFAKIL